MKVRLRDGAWGKDVRKPLWWLTHDLADEDLEIVEVGTAPSTMTGGHSVQAKFIDSKERLITIEWRPLPGETNAYPDPPEGWDGTIT